MAKEHAEGKRYEALGPFELKNKLAQLAETRHDGMMLNANRGNPNRMAMPPREGLFQLGLFAIEEFVAKKKGDSR